VGLQQQGNAVDGCAIKHPAAADLLAALPRTLRDLPQAALQQLLQQELHAQPMFLFMHAAAQQAISGPQYPAWAYVAANGSARAAHQCSPSSMLSRQGKAQASTAQLPQHQQNQTELPLTSSGGAAAPAAAAPAAV
jgi:hypothetical protein